MFEYLVSSKSKKKLVRVEEKKDVADEIYKIFGIPAWAQRLQMYVDSFEEYADVEDAEELPASCKMLAVDLREESLSCAASSEASMAKMPW